MTLYEGIVSAVGTMAENKNDMGKLLRILATDEDYGPEVKIPLKTFFLLVDAKLVLLCCGFGSSTINVCIFFTKGKNPNIIYSVIGSEFFSLNDGYLFMTTQLVDGTYDLGVRSSFE